MKERSIISLKRCLKKRKRITEALIVIFLITGSIGYGREIINSNNVPEDGILNISAEETTYLDGMDIEVDGVTLINNGNIKGYHEDTTPLESWSSPYLSYLGNGIVVGESLTDVKINNNGIISGELKVDTTSSEEEMKVYGVENSGNGVKGDVEVNNGVISGKLDVITGGSLDLSSNSMSDSFSFYTGNGVLGDVGVNNGVISGKLDVTTGTNFIPSDPYSRAYSSSSIFSETDGNGVTGNVGINNGVISGLLDTTNGDSLFLTNRLFRAGSGVMGSVGVNNGTIKGVFSATTGDSFVQAQAPSFEMAMLGNGVGGEVGVNDGVIKGMVNLIAEHVKYPNFSYGSGNGVIGSIEANNGVINGAFNMVFGETSDTSSPNLSEFGNGVGSKMGVRSKIRVNNGMITGMSSTVYKNLFSNYSDSSGNGVKGEVGVNNGVINGNLNTATGDGFNSSSVLSGNGVYGIITKNKGISRGNIRVDAGKFSFDGGETWKKASDSRFFSGHGMAYMGESIYSEEGLTDDIVNSGLIAGNGSAIALNESASHTGTITNYGILVGRKIISDGEELIAHEDDYMTDKELTELKDSDDISYINYGLEIVLDDDGTGHTSGSIVSVTKGENGTADIDGETFTIKNTDLVGTTDSFETISSATTYDNHIINGAGVASGTLTIDNAEVTLTNSIVNGYEKAITIKDGGTLTATDTIFNGGGIGTWVDVEDEDGRVRSYLEYTNVIEGDSGNNTINLSGNSIINGKVNLGGGDDTMSIGSTVQINGDMFGGEGGDTLTLGDTPYIQSELDKGIATTVDYEKSLKIYHSINGFEDINIEGSVILYETANISDAKEITILNNSTLNLRIDPTVVIDGKVVGHALYDSGATISGWTSRFEGVENNTAAGTLNLVTSGLGTGSIIAMGDTELDDRLYVRTDSLIHKAEKIGDGDIKIDIGKDLSEIFDYITMSPEMEPLAPQPDPETPSIVEPSQPEKPNIPEWVEKNNYEKIDKIYQSTITSGDDNVNALYPTVNLNDKSEDKAGENLLYLLNDIFMANPYGYASHSSHETFGLFNESILSDKFKPNEGNWLIYGRLNVGGSDYDNDYNNHFRANYYGFDTEKVVINSESRNYGGYGKAEYGLTDKTSAGIMVGGANSKTDISNGSKLDGDSLYLGGYGKTEINNFRLVGGVGYQYGNFDTTRIAKNDYQSFKHEEEMRTDSFGVYGGVTYEYSIDEKWSVEPNARLSYTNVRQSSVNEGDTILGINVDSENKGYLDGEVGVDVVRAIQYENSTGKLRLGVAYEHSFDGADKSYLTGRFQGGSDFDILIPEKTRSMTRVKASYDVEYDSGVVFDIGGGYTFGKDASDYYVGVGIGYKFNNLKDFMPQKNTVIEEPVEVMEIIEDGDVIATRILGGFALNSAVLTDEIKVELDKLVEKLKTSDTKEIKIIGHTDSTGPARFNEVLSLERAKSAKRYLEARLELIEEIQTEGRGSADPIESNDTPEGRRLNRRVRVEY